MGGSILKWTKEKCSEEALKYITRNEFLTKSPGAYNSARNNGWLPDICAHMKRLCNIKDHWSNHTCREEALKFETRSEFHKKSGSAYIAATKLNILDEICSHMITPIRTRLWTRENCQEEAAKYNNKSDFRANSAKAYSAAQKNGWLNDICSHMIAWRKPKGFWIKENCRQEALKYASRSEFNKCSSRAYLIAKNNNWLEELCIHMIITRKPGSYLSKDQFQSEALKYNSRSEFQKNSNVAYTKACRMKWIDEISAHMNSIKKPNNYWSLDRCSEIAREFDTIKEFREKAGNIYAYAHRKKWIEQICVHMKRTRKPAVFWTKEAITEEAAKYKTRSEFNKKSPTAATQARGWGWYEEIWTETHPDENN